MLETFIVASTTFFATIGPLDVVAMFAGLTATETQQHRRRMALRGILISASILIFFALIGELLLSSLGISLAALKVSGGILLILIGIEMVFGHSDDDHETAVEAPKKQEKDISVFPLATPLIAGPGTMGAVILLMADTGGVLIDQTAVVLALISILLFTFLLLLFVSKVQSLLGATGLHVIGRVFGVLLCALAVQFVFDGISQSGLLTAVASR